MSLLSKGAPEQTIGFTAPKYVPGTRSARKTQAKPTPNCHRRSHRTHVATVDDVWEEDAQMHWLVAGERARREGANWALEVGANPNICFAGPAGPISRHYENSPDRRRSRSGSLLAIGTSIAVLRLTSYRAAL